MGKKATSCSSFAQLTSGQMYPADATSAEGTVGGMDVAVTRDDTEDFKRCVRGRHGARTDRVNVGGCVCVCVCVCACACVRACALYVRVYA